METKYMEYTEALAEVDEIIKYFDKSLFEKIPENFKEFIEQAKDKDYKFEYNKNLPLEKQDIKEETKIILSLIYRSYLVSPEEKERLQKEALESLEKEKAEKYNIDNMVRNKKVEEQNIPKTKAQTTVAMTVVKNENIITRIWNAIKSVFFSR